MSQRLTFLHPLRGMPETIGQLETFIPPADLAQTPQAPDFLHLLKQERLKRHWLQRDSNPYAHSFSDGDYFGEQESDETFAPFLEGMGRDTGQRGVWLTGEVLGEGGIGRILGGFMLAGSVWAPVAIKVQKKAQLKGPVHGFDHEQAMLTFVNQVLPERFYYLGQVEIPASSGEAKRGIVMDRAYGDLVKGYALLASLKKYEKSRFMQDLLAQAAHLTREGFSFGGDAQFLIDKNHQTRLIDFGSSTIVTTPPTDRQWDTLFRAFFEALGIPSFYYREPRYWLSPTASLEDIDPLQLNDLVWRHEVHDRDINLLALLAHDKFEAYKTYHNSERVFKGRIRELPQGLKNNLILLKNLPNYDYFEAILEHNFSQEKVNSRSTGLLVAALGYMKHYTQMVVQAYPDDWAQLGLSTPSNVFDIQTNYKAARLLLHEKAQVPVGWVPSIDQQIALLEIHEQLKKSEPKVFWDCLRDLFALLDQPTKKSSILGLLEQSTLETLVDLYLGPQQLRYVKDHPTAIKVVELLKRWNLTHEGFMASVNLKSGKALVEGTENRQRQHSADSIFSYYILSNDRYELNTVISEESPDTQRFVIDPKRTDFLPTRKFILESLHKAIAVFHQFAQGAPVPFYDAAARIVKQWFFSPQGVSHFRIHLHENGTPKMAQLLYAPSIFHPDTENIATAIDELDLDNLPVPIMIMQGEASDIEESLKPDGLLFPLGITTSPAMNLATGFAR